MSKYYAYNTFAFLVFFQIFLLTLSFNTKAQRRGSPQISSPTPIPTLEQNSNKKSEKNKNNNKNGNQPNPDYGPEIIIPSLGIKLRDMNFPIEPEYIAKRRAELCSKPNTDPNSCKTPIVRIHVVTAVQENSTAYFMGLTPGDIINENRWGANDLTQLAKKIDRSFSDLYPHQDLDFYYIVNDSPYPKQISIQFPFNFDDPRDGKWLTQIPVHKSNERTLLPGVAEARKTFGLTYDQLLKETLSKIRNNPCSFTSEDLVRASYELEKIESWSNVRFFPPHYQALIAGAKTLCENSKQGELSNIEMAIVGITSTNSLKACDYKATTDYHYLLNDFFADLGGYYNQVEKFSKSSYNKNSQESIRRYLIEAPPDQKQCFLNILKSSLIDTNNKSS